MTQVTPNKQALLEELDRVCSSEDFRGKPMMVRMLSYLVRELADGREDHIKGYSIALDVFDQRESFDPNTSALVRNNAVRLRALLKTYYLGEGSKNPLVIELPKGKYVPKVAANSAPGDQESASAAMDTRRRLVIDESEAPSIAVIPFSNLSTNPAMDYFATGFAHDLADMLTRYELRVLGVAEAEENGNGEVVANSAASAGADFWVTGDVVAFGTNVKITFRLFRKNTGEQLWANSARFDTEDDDLFEFQEDLTERIASLICGEYGQINQHRYETLLHSRPGTPGEQRVLLRHYHHATVLSQESMDEFQRELLLALKAQPDSALLNACASGIYSNRWTFALPDADTALEMCKHYAEKAYVLNPSSQWVLINLAFKCFICDERDRFFTLFQQCEHTVANTPLRLGAWAAWISYWGEWEQGQRLLDRVYANNIHIPGWLHGTNCLYHFRLNAYEEALEHAQKMQIPSMFWGPALRAATLGHLDRAEEARGEFARLMEVRPDFDTLGQTLMIRILKDASLVEHIREGFRKFGEDVA